jgi:hypothetical protein
LDERAVPERFPTPIGSQEYTAFLSLAVLPAIQVFMVADLPRAIPGNIPESHCN